MERKKVLKGLAALICLLVLLMAIAGVVSVLGWQISELTKDITLIKQQVVEIGSRVQLYIFNHFGISAFQQTQLLKEEQPSYTGIIQMMAGSLAYFYVNFILVLAYIFLLLYYRSHIKHFILKLFLHSRQKEMEHVVDRVTHVSQQYIVGLSKMIVCLWIMYGIGFSVLGVKNALFFSFLCGLLEIVPFIGNITGTILTVLVAAVHGASFPMLGGIIGIYGAVQFIQGWLLEPILVGPQVKINPLFTIIALVIGQLVWGIPGIFLAIPITAMFKIVCDHIEPLKPLGFLIGETETRKREQGFIKKIRSWFQKSRNN
ncbi:MAG: AI-2E family transporter [Bacteroidetes bacterium]|nr:MAG: AI-2E family transporter [Bacteroidota bacterium]